MKDIGYDDRPLFVQPFDHRTSFTRSFFGFEGTPTISPERDEHSPVCAAKTLIYRALLLAIERGVPADEVGILVDSQFGSHIVADAKSRGIPVAVAIEKSGRRLFDFEFGPRWQDHLRLVAPDVVKVLVRYHPEDDAGDNRDQLTRLRTLSDFLHAGDHPYLMFELLVPRTTPADERAGERYDAELRPAHTVEAIRQIQDFGIEPDLWKIEGVDERAQAEAVAKQIRSVEARRRVGALVLGRGSSEENVRRWLEAAAPVEGFIGFAVGRTNFAEPLANHLKGEIDAAQAIEIIAARYMACVDVWRDANG